MALLVINTDKATSETLRLPTPTERYTLASSDLQSSRVRLNGTELTWDGTGDERPGLARTGARVDEAHSGDRNRERIERFHSEAS